MDKSLLVLSPLLPDESLSSLLYRLSDVVGYRRSQQMVIQLCRERLTQKDSVTHPSKSETFKVISDLTRIEAETLY